MLLDVYINVINVRPTGGVVAHPGLRRFSQCVFKRIGSVYFYEVENTVVGGGWRSLSRTQWLLFGGLLKKIHIVTNWPNKSGINAEYYLCVYIYIYTVRVNSPAALASLHSRYMSDFISGLSSAMVSPTVTNRSMAKFTPCPTLAIALAVLSVQNGRSRCATNVDICNATYNNILY